MVKNAWAIELYSWSSFEFIHYWRRMWEIWYICYLFLVKAILAPSWKYFGRVAPIDFSKLSDFPDCTIVIIDRCNFKRPCFSWQPEASAQTVPDKFCELKTELRQNDYSDKKGTRSMRSQYFFGFEIKGALFLKCTKKSPRSKG